MRIVYGMSRQEALALPAWEFDLLASYAHKHQARQDLDLYRVMSIAAWGDKKGRAEFVNNLVKMADYRVHRKKKTPPPTQEELSKRLRSLPGLAMLPVVE